MGRTGSRGRHAKLVAAGRKGGQTMTAAISGGTTNTTVSSTTTHLPSISNIVVDNRRQSTAHTHKILRARDPLKAPSGSCFTVHLISYYRFYRARKIQLIIRYQNRFIMNDQSNLLKQFRSPMRQA